MPGDWEQEERQVRRRSRERGPATFRFTWADLAEQLGKSERTLRRWRSQGRFDPRRFASVVVLLKACWAKEPGKKR